MADKKMHRCPHEGCTSSFNRPYRLAQHMLVHKNVKAFACPEENCTKAYTNKSHLDRHINTIHKKDDEDVIYSCPTCMKVYSNRQNLKRHIRLHHKVRVQFSCDTCKVEFSKKHMLSTHMFQHTGIKAFSCEVCSEEFISLYEKKRHLRNHKTHICSQCNSQFQKWSKLQKHLKRDHVGQEFICNECSRSFKHRDHLIRHIKIHDKLIFACPFENCKRFYSRNSNLKQHLAMKHEGIRHECFICNAQLSTKAKLDEHVMRIHTNDPKKRIYKTKKTGRSERKDAGSFKLSAAAVINRIVPAATTPDLNTENSTQNINETECEEPINA